MDKVTSADGTHIVYERFGEGAPLLLVDGAFNDRQSPWSGIPLARMLASERTVYAYDRRGRGTAATPGRSPPSVRSRTSGR